MKQKLFLTDSKKWLKSEVRDVISTHSPALLKQKALNNLRYLHTTIKNNSAYSRGEIGALERKIKHIERSDKKIFKNVDKVQTLYNYIARKNAKNPQGGLNKGIRGRTVSNERIFTKAGKLRKRFHNRAVNFNNLSIEHIGIILGRFLKGWIKRSLIFVDKIWSHDYIEEAKLGVYKISFLVYDEQLTVQMIQDKFGINKDEIFYATESEHVDGLGSSELIIRAEFTDIIERFVTSGWHYGGN